MMSDEQPPSVLDVSSLFGRLSQGVSRVHGRGELRALPDERADEVKPSRPKRPREANDETSAASIRFFRKAGLDYVSCSPFRVAVTRLAAAQAARLKDDTHKGSGTA